MSAIPSYYRSPANRDVYDLLIEQFGFTDWAKHAEMEVVQYLFRARRKENYRLDLVKAKVILDRILIEHERYEAEMEPKK